MTSSSLGFGTQAWGDFPWGEADWAEVMLWKGMPEIYRNMDENAPGLVANPLRSFINAIKPSFNDILQKLSAFPALWDGDKCRVDQLPTLLRNIGLPNLEDKSEAFSRIVALNAVQLYLHKGTDKGYRIIASFEGLVVGVIGLWAWTCEPDSVLTTEGPTFFVANFDEVPGDFIHADTIYTDRFAIWPYPLTRPVNPTASLLLDEIPLDVLPLDSGLMISEGRCRSHKIRLNFYKPDDTEIEDFDGTSDRILTLVDFMKPEHVEVETLTFDGPKASATWESQIIGDNAAVATWEGSITGAIYATASWTSSISADLET